MTGIRAIVDRTVIEDVRVYIDPVGAPIAEDVSCTEVGFGRELWASGIEITVQDCVVERASRDGVLISLYDGAVRHLARARIS